MLRSKIVRFVAMIVNYQLNDRIVAPDSENMESCATTASVCATEKPSQHAMNADATRSGAIKNRAQVRAATKLAKQEESQGIADILKEEGLLDADTMQELGELDYLTAKPVEEDVLVHAIAHCAPWNALQSFKYKVKLTPGKMKKGKAIKQVREIMMKQKNSHPLEQECLKVLSDADMIRTIISNITVVGQSASSKGKGQGKSGRKKKK